jgi:hypothetical protein
MATTLKNEGSVKILRNGEQPQIQQRRITSSDAVSLPPNYRIVPMKVLDHPEPIRGAKKK